MSLPPGTKLGPYEILAPLGAGGMGEVYRARDTRLAREVAVKVLPASFSRDPERVKRFDQEARAAGMLNHPNILAIYDVGEFDGAPYVVSELLEGETLRERLRGGALAQRRAIEFALQAVQGLAAAHDKGIFHRDLKPENLFVTSDGRVKILDFGLAKLTHAPEAPDGVTSAGTETLATEPGKILGTVGYMAPEQVRAKPADHRSDIFSFGAILYEMLSGRRAFQKDTQPETMTAILKEDARELSSPEREISPALERVVSHCLEKNPEMRFQSARDLAFALEAVSSPSGVAPAVAADDVSAAVRTPPQRYWRRALPWTIAAMVLSATLAFWAGKRAGETAPPSFHRLTFRHGTIYSARFAPDGQTILYAAAWDGKPVEIFSTRPESSESRSLGLADTVILAISSSGELAVGLHPRVDTRGPTSRIGTLARMPLGGGAPREVLNDVEWADWSPDGSNLAVVRPVEGKVRLEYPIGKVLYETQGWISHIRIAPDGKRVGFLDHPVFGDDAGNVAVVGPDGKTSTLSSGWASVDGLAWSPKRDEVWFTGAKTGSARALYAVTVQGRLRPVARVAQGMTLWDIFPDGRVLVNGESTGAGIAGMAPGANKERDLSWLDWGSSSDLSADGRTFLFDEEGDGGGPDYSVYIRGTDGSPAVRLGDGRSLSLSPDGKWALTTNIHRLPEQLVLLPTGAGEPQTLTHDAIDHYYAWLLPDGKRILFDGSEPGHSRRAYAMGIGNGDVAPHALTAEGVEPLPLHPLSPDGKFFVARDVQRGSTFLYLSEGGQPHPLSGIGASEYIAGWTEDGRSVYVFTYGELSARVTQVELATGKRQAWKELIPADPAGIIGINQISIAQDGKAYIYQYARFLCDLYLVEGLK